MGILANSAQMLGVIFFKQSLGKGTWAVPTFWVGTALGSSGDVVSWHPARTIHLVEPLARDWVSGVCRNDPYVSVIQVRAVSFCFDPEVVSRSIGDHDISPGGDGVIWPIDRCSIPGGLKLVPRFLGGGEAGQEEGGQDGQDEGEQQVLSHDFPSLGKKKRG
jgi:hypothetical protein